MVKNSKYFTMKDKKAYLRTLEVFMAFLATFIFVIYVVPTYVTGDAPAESINLLTPLANDLRECGNASCVESIITDFDPDFARRYDYKINISTNLNAVVTGLPRKNIYTDSVYMAGNITNYSPRIIRLYYWE